MTKNIFLVKGKVSNWRDQIIKNVKNLEDQIWNAIFAQIFDHFLKLEIVSNSQNDDKEN